MKQLLALGLLGIGSLSCPGSPSPTIDPAAGSAGAAPAAETAARPATSGPRTDGPAAAAVVRSFDYLVREGTAWMDGKAPVQSGDGCVSCHQVPFGLWGLEEARRAGLEVPAEALEALSSRAGAFVSKPRNGATMARTPLILAHRDGRGDDVEPWREMRLALTGAQRPDGAWAARGQFGSQRRPAVESDAVATLWTLLALAPPGGDGDGDGVADVRRRALEWIDSLGDVSGEEQGTSTEWVLARLLVERRWGEPAAAEELLEEALTRQGEDGGWGWRAGEPSNAYSTGQALYSLAVVGVDPGSPAVERGVGYLVGSQASDGAWQVPSRLTSKKPSSDNDYIYDYWGTAWATIGLARTVTSAAGAPAPAEPAG